MVLLQLKPEEVAPQEAGSQGALSVYEKNMTPFEKGFFASFGQCSAKGCSWVCCCDNPLHTIPIVTCMI